MKVFWISIAGGVGLCLLGLQSGPRQTTYFWRPTIVQVISREVFAALLVTAIWGILFRSQIERRRVSLSALFVLLALEAGWFAAKQRFGSW